MDFFSKIINGIPVSIKFFPFIALVIGKNQFKEYLCTGSHIGNGYILTAAHCVYNRSDLDFYVFFNHQSLDSVAYQHINQIQDIYIHPEFNSESFTHDIAIISTLQDISSKLDLLPSAEEYAIYEDFGSELHILGYGTTENQVNDIDLLSLHYGNVTVVDPSLYHVPIDPTMMLAEGVVNNNRVTDSCQGDSGGPLYSSADNVLVGTVSWGILCGFPQYPGVYSKISSSIEWILSIVLSKK